MKKNAVLLGLIFCLFACGSDTPSVQTTSTVNYYIDAVSGSDNNAGTIDNNPWQTFTNLATTSFSTNATIYLNRGDTWNEQLTISASNLNIDAYGTGALPIIDSSMAISGWTDLTGGFYSHMVTVAAGEGLGNITQDGVMMSFVAWDNDFATSFTGASNESFSFDWANSTLYIKTASDPASKAYRASLKLFGITAEGKSNISVKNVSITRFSLSGINFKNCVNCTVSDSVVSSGGGAVLVALAAGSGPDYLYAGNGIEFGNSSINGGVSNTIISNIFDSGLSPQTYASNLTAGPFTFDKITISKCGFAGIEISVLNNNGTTNSSIDGVTMSNINVANSGKGWSGQRYSTEGYGIRIKADAGAGAISNVSLSTSEITGSKNSGIKLAGESNVVSISRSRIYGNDSNGVELEEATASSLRLDISASLIYANGGYGVRYNSPTAAGFNVLQNTFYNNTTTNFGVLTHSGIAKIQNNIFSSNTGLNDIYVATTLSGVIFDNNCFEDHTSMFNYNGGGIYSTLAAFNSAYPSFEVNGSGAGPIGLAAPASGNFSISTGSSCDNLGDATVGIATDYAGNRFANPPASGAYEAQ